MTESIAEISKNQKIIFNNEFIDKIIVDIEAANNLEIKSSLKDLHAADIAELLEFLSTNQRTYLLNQLDSEDYTDVLAELDDSIIDQTVNLLQHEKVAKSISDMETDDAVGLIESLEPDTQKKILDKVSAEDREIFNESLNYPEDTAGRRMQKEIVSMPSFWTVGQAIDYLRDEEELPEDFFELFIVDPSNKPLGSVSVSKVLRSNRKIRLNDITIESPIFIPADMDQEEAAMTFEKYSLVSAGVVDKNGRLIGRLTADDIMWVLQEEAEEDILRMGGVIETEMNQGIIKSTRKRFIWLFLNLLTAILASIVISFFDASIEKMVALAVLMPIVASMGGNAGTQTLTLTVRALATKDLVQNNRRKIFSKEISISILNSIIFAIITAVAAQLWFQDFYLSIIVGSAMVVNILSAGFFGFLIPYGLNYFRVDPAIASSVFVTTITDVVGFLSFLGLASIFLF
jgi:magnesium transporter|tara:strand:+ start:2235 stop:3611 length:1377 start_codon:yes stop_codon:yes gene_type:complete